jgi:hypothetical protein
LPCSMVNSDLRGVSACSVSIESPRRVPRCRLTDLNRPPAIVHTICLVDCSASHRFLGLGLGLSKWLSPAPAICDPERRVPASGTKKLILESFRFSKLTRSRAGNLEGRTETFPQFCFRQDLVVFHESKEGRGDLWQVRVFAHKMRTCHMDSRFKIPELHQLATLVRQMGSKLTTQLRLLASREREALAHMFRGTGEARRLRSQGVLATRLHCRIPGSHGELTLPFRTPRRFSASDRSLHPRRFRANGFRRTRRAGRARFASGAVHQLFTRRFWRTSSNKRLLRLY